MTAIKRIDLSPLHNQGNGGLNNTELVDGKHVIVKCSNCGKELCDVWIIQPSFKMSSKVVAQCDFCGDKSYETAVDGKIQIGTVGDKIGIIDVRNNFTNGTEDDRVYQKIVVKTKRI